MIKYRVIKRGTPGVTGGGEQKYYASLPVRDVLTIRTLAEQISRRTTLTATDVIATLEAFIAMVPEHMLNGKIVKLGDFGTFRINIKSSASTEAKDVSVDNITGNRVVFNPGKLIKKKLKLAEYKKVDD